MFDITNFDLVRNKIHERLLSSEWHKQKIEMAANEPVVADLFLTWYVDVSEWFGDGAVAYITPALIDEWGITLSDVKALASRNDNNRYTVTSMADTMKSILARSPEIVVDIEEVEARKRISGVYVISNLSCLYGAAGILNPNIQYTLNQIYADTGFIILPASVHEMITIPISDDIMVDELGDFVAEVNRDKVEERDRLSDHIYAIKDGQLVIM